MTDVPLSLRADPTREDPEKLCAWTAGREAVRGLGEASGVSEAPRGLPGLTPLFSRGAASS